MKTRSAVKRSASGTKRQAGTSRFLLVSGSRCAIENPSDEWPIAAIGIDMNHERTWVSVSFAFFTEHGLHVELTETEAYTEGSQTSC